MLSFVINLTHKDSLKTRLMKEEVEDRPKKRKLFHRSLHVDADARYRRSNEKK